jgi:hypothetical protein
MIGNKKSAIMIILEKVRDNVISTEDAYTILDALLNDNTNWIPPTQGGGNIPIGINPIYTMTGSSKKFQYPADEMEHTTTQIINN